MKTKSSEGFWEGVQRLAKLHRERCKTDPVLRASWERSKKKSACSKTHKEWVQDYDVHGPLDSYCTRCGACDAHYSPQFDYKESFMTCDELLAAKK